MGSIFLVYIFRPYHICWGYPTLVVEGGGGNFISVREAQDNLALVSKPQLTNNSTQQSNRENGCLYFWPIARYVRERLLELSHISCGSGWWWLYKCEGKPHPLSKLFRLREVQDHLPICESHYENYLFISWVHCLTFVFRYIDILQS